MFLYTDETTYYVVDSAKIIRSQEDSIRNHDLFVFEKDPFLSFSDKQTSIEQGDPTNHGHEGFSRPFTLEGDDGILALLLLCFVLFTRIYKGGLAFFNENIRLLFSFRKNQNLFAETTTTEFWFNFILIFQAILLASIVMFDFILESEDHLVPNHSFYTIILFIFTITIFLLLRYLFYRFLGFIFQIKEQIEIWLRNYILVIEMMGVIAFIPTLMLVYSQNFHQYLLIFFIVLFIISRLILFYRLAVFFLQGHVNFLFLIPYLCSVEIIPYMILYQVLIYLYKVDIINLL